ncbi:MAG: DUF5668 domain-containing protein [bacterium]|nr:DUF5668 domain-containing protein [bacterium]
MDEQVSGKMCGSRPCPCHAMIPLFIVLIGVAFLLNTLNVIDEYTLSIVWPILLILLGLKKMFKGLCGCCK